MRTHTKIRYAFYLALSGLVVCLSCGCATRNVYNDLIAQPLASVQNTGQTITPITHRPKLGIAFGGGGVRGFMHIGVIKALEEHHIQADVVTGSSAGSFIASAYASGLNYEQISRMADDLGVWDIADLVVSHRGGIQGQKIAQWVNTRLGNEANQSRIEHMPLPLGIAVTDINKQQALLVTQGNVGQAVQASSSIPGAFIPVKVKGQTWVDGGVLALVPVHFTKAMGADVVIGVDVYCGNFPSRLEQGKDKEGFTTMLYFSSRLQTCALNKTEFNTADVTISPDFEPKSISSFKSKQQAIEAGYQSTLKVIPKIKALLTNKHFSETYSQ